VTYSVLAAGDAVRSWFLYEVTYSAVEIRGGKNGLGSSSFWDAGSTHQVTYSVLEIRQFWSLSRSFTPHPLLPTSSILPFERFNSAHISHPTMEASIA